jgi:hypothetical protein
MRRQLTALHPGDPSFLYMDQAGPTVGHWLSQSVEQIDATFGEGYAKKNPALVAAFVQAAAIDQLTAHLANTVCQRLDDIAHSLSGPVADYGHR